MSEYPTRPPRRVFGDEPEMFRGLLPEQQVILHAIMDRWGRGRTPQDYDYVFYRLITDALERFRVEVIWPGGDGEVTDE
jgi:hypothetical protein